MNGTDILSHDTALDLSIVIVNWNTRDFLAQCLNSLVQTLNPQAPGGVRPSGIRRQPPATVEVQVVDNLSIDGSSQMLVERFPWVRLIENRENVGFARANNQAIRESTAPYVLLLNPDTEVKSDAVGMLVRFLNEHPEVGGVGPRLLNPDGTLQASCHPAPTLLNELWQMFHLDALRLRSTYPMATWDLEIPQKVDVLQGACLLLRRAALDQVGLLDEDYFIYSEEVDLCYRLRRAGWSLYWAPKAQVVHYGGQSTQQAASEMFLQLYKSKLLYFRKHHGRQAARLYKVILGAAALARLSLSPLAWLARLPQRRRHMTLAGHYLRLLRALPEI